MSLSREQRGEFPRGYDPRGFMTAEGKQAAFIAGYKIIGIANFREGQQKIIARIRRAFDAQQGTGHLGEVFQLVDQAAGFIGFDAFGDGRLLQRGAQSSSCSAQVRSVKRPSCQAV